MTTNNQTPGQMPARPGWFSETADIILISQITEEDTQRESGQLKTTSTTRMREIMRADTYAALEQANAMHRIADALERIAANGAYRGR